MNNYRKLYILLSLMSLYNSAANALFGYTIKNSEIAKAKYETYVKTHEKAQQKACEDALDTYKKAMNDCERKYPKSSNENYQEFKYPVDPSAPNIEDESKSNSFTIGWKEKLIHSAAQTVHLVTLTGIFTRLMTKCALAYAKRK
jgi:hypothetical protein